MKNILFLLLVSAFALPVYAAEGAGDEQNFERLCKEYAKDDEIKSDEMEEYMETCIAELKASAEESEKDK